MITLTTLVPPPPDTLFSEGKKACDGLVRPGHYAKDQTVTSNPPYQQSQIRARRPNWKIHRFCQAPAGRTRPSISRIMPSPLLLRAASTPPPPGGAPPRRDFRRGERANAKATNSPTTLSNDQRDQPLLCHRHVETAAIISMRAPNCSDRITTGVSASSPRNDRQGVTSSNRDQQCRRQHPGEIALQRCILQQQREFALPCGTKPCTALRIPAATSRQALVRAQKRGARPA